MGSLKPSSGTQHRTHEVDDESILVALDHPYLLSGAIRVDTDPKLPEQHTVSNTAEAASTLKEVRGTSPRTLHG